VLPSTPRATTGSSGATPPPEPATEEVVTEVVDVPMPRPRPHVVHHASIKAPVVALRDLHAAQ